MNVNFRKLSCLKVISVFSFGLSFVTFSFFDISTAHASKIQTFNKYVALGDSRASAPQKFGDSFDGCVRSNTGYPYVIDNILKPKQFVDVSCAYATMNNIVHPQKEGFFSRPPQIDSVTPTTDLVTLSIGGNDINWPFLIAPCFTPKFGQDAKCRDNKFVAQRAEVAIKHMEINMVQVLFAIHARAPLAKVYVIGHGGMYGDMGCPIQAQSSDKDLEWINNNFFADINNSMNEAATDTGSYFVNIDDLAKGHDACQPSSLRWFAGNASTDDTPARHPTKLGSYEIGRYIASIIESPSMSQTNIEDEKNKQISTNNINISKPEISVNNP